MSLLAQMKLTWRDNQMPDKLYEVEGNAASISNAWEHLLSRGPRVHSLRVERDEAEPPLPAPEIEP